MKHRSTQITGTDLFCGAGGSSEGFEMAGGEVMSAANHWKLACETYNTNHGQDVARQADVSTTNPRSFPSTDILLASPECTNHSLAKGGQKPKAQLDLYGSGPGSSEEAERSRATMWDVPRFTEAHHYETVVVENVVEARNWVMFDAWLMAMDAMGYAHRALFLNSMFFGVPQSRDRMYMVFWRKGNKAPLLDFHPAAPCFKCEKVVGAVQSWKNPSRPWGKYKSQYLYACPRCGIEVRPYVRPAAAIIDWSDKGDRIGDRLRPLAPATIERIKSGIKKYWKEGMVIPLDHTSTHKDGTGLGQPTQTLTTRADKGVVLPFIAELRGGSSDSRSVTDPMATVTASGNHHGLVMPPLYIKNFGDGSDPSMAHEVTDPLGTVTTQDHHSILNPPLVVKVDMSHSDRQVRSVEETLSTVTAASWAHALFQGPDGLLVQVGGSLYERKSYARVRSTDEVMFTQSATPATALLVPAGGTWNEEPTSTNDPMRALTTREAQALVQDPHFIYSYYSGGGQIHPVDQPIPTIPTGERHGLVAAAPDIEDCHFRMLEPAEIKGGMAFPASYNIIGNKRQQVRQLGNAVTPPVMAWINGQVIAALSGEKTA